MMSENTQEFDGIDFEALMRSKSWDALLPEEKALIGGFVSGEEEYSLMRETLLMLAEAPLIPEPPLNPGLKDRLMDAFDRQYPPEPVPVYKPRFTDISRKTWMSVAAAAALFIAVASVWYLVSDTLYKPSPSPPTLAGNLNDTAHQTSPEVTPQDASEDKGTTSPFEDENLTDSRVFSKDTLQKNPVAAGKVADESGKDRLQFTETRQTGQGSTAIDRNAAAAKAEIPKSPQQQWAFADQEASTDSVFKKHAESETLVKQVTIVSERSRPQKYIPEKKLRTAPRPVSSDPLLLDFLFACP